jgi:hypothetical protein
VTPLPARRCWRPTVARGCRTRRHAERGRPHRDEKAETERGAGRRREHLHSAAFFVKLVTTTPLPRCENLSFPPFFCAALILDSMLVGVPSRRLAPCTLRRCSSIDVRRVTPHQCKPNTVATPGHNVGRS